MPRNRFRELRKVLEQAVLLSRDGRIDASQLTLSSNAAEVAGASPGAQAPATLADMERQMLTRALERTGGNQTRNYIGQSGDLGRC